MECKITQIENLQFYKLMLQYVHVICMYTISIIRKKSSTKTAKTGKNRNANNINVLTSLVNLHYDMM